MAGYKKRMGIFNIIGIFLLVFLYSGFQSFRERNLAAFGQRSLFVGLIFCVTVFCYFWLKKRESDMRLLDAAIKYRYPICGLYALIFLILGIHGFSLDIWAAYIPPNSSTITRLFGNFRGITSDVWAISIPWLFNQIANGFPLHNDTIMYSGHNMLLLGMPVLDITLIGQPQFWGSLLGSHVGLSWLYWFEKFGMLFSSYEILVFLTKDKKRLSMLGAFILTASPLMNWWFGRTASRSIVFMQICVACVVHFFQMGNSRRKKTLLGIGAGIGLAAYVYSLYPPTQITFGYLALILVCGAVIRFWKEGGRLNRGDILTMVLVVVSSLLLIGRFLLLSLDGITALNHSVYPGHREFFGGGFTYQVASAYYLLNPFLARESRAPMALNQLELSSVLPFLPTIIILVPIVLIFAWRKEKSLKGHGLTLALYLYFLFALSWLFVTYPAWFARLSLMSYVHPSRMTWLIGILSVYLAIMTMDYLWKEKITQKIWAVIISLVSTGALYFVSRNNFDLEYIRINQIPIPPMLMVVGLFVAFAIFNFVYLNGNKKLAIAALLTLSILFEYSISPTEMGSYAFNGSNLAREVREIGRYEPEAVWVAEDDFFYGNFLSAMGVRVFNVSNMYEDVEKWSLLDPTGQYKDMYNRYANVQVVIKAEPTSLVLPVEDFIFVNLSVDDLEKMGIRYVLTPRMLTEEEGIGDYFEFIGEINSKRLFQVR